MIQNNLLKRVTNTNIKAYKKQLESQGLSVSSIKRKLSSVAKFTAFAKSKGYLKDNPFEKETKLFEVKPVEKVPARELLSFEPRKWLKAYQSITPTRYLHWAILMIICAALGFGVYDQFIRRAPEQYAYPSSLTRPNRTLSFQGRLTDSSNNPISSITNVNFDLYNVGTGGTALWSSGDCSIDPDIDGIFSTLLGGDCGSEIDESVFSENQGIWLQITVGTSPNDEILDPRIQIATVAYALNAETLQGYPPASPATANTIPIINSSGNLVIGATSPMIQATSGTFTIEGQTGVTIQAGSGQDGNINLYPKGTGTITLSYEASTGSLLNVQGGANLGASGDKEDNVIIYGYAGTDSTNLYLTKLQSGSSPTTKFSVDTEGDTFIAGNLGVGTSSPLGKLQVTGDEVRIGSSGTVDYATGDGDLYVQDDLEVDGTIYGNISGTINPNFTEGSIIFQGASGLSSDPSQFFWNNSSNFLGIGTSNPQVPLEVAGEIRGTKFAFQDSTGAYLDTLATNKITLATDNTDRLVIDSSGNVGIGTTTPAYKLHLLGTVDSYLGYLSNGSTGSSAGGLYIRSDGQADILTLNYQGSNVMSVSGTQASFDVPTSFNAAGDVSMAYDLVFTNATASYIKSYAPLYIEAGKSFNSSDLTLKTYNSGQLVFDLAGGAAFTQAQEWNLADSSTTSLNIESGLFNLDTTNSRVGIGTTAPTSTLHVSGSMRLTGAFYDVNNEAGNNGQVLSTTGSGTDWVDISSIGIGGSGTTNYLSKFLSSTTLTNAQLFDNGTFVGIGGTAAGTNPHVYVKASDGNVGIGTTGPSQKLEVNGNMRVQGSRIYGVNDLAYIDLYNPSTGNINIFNTQNHASFGHIILSPGNSEKVRITNAGNVGIGTTGPGAKLDIYGNSGDSILRILSGNSANHRAVRLGDTTEEATFAVAVGNNSWITGTVEGDTILRSYDTSRKLFLGTGSTAGLVINNGNVGIGTTGPGTLLDLDKDTDSTYFRIQRSSQNRSIQMSPSVNATTYGLSAGRQQIEATGDLLIISGNGGGGGDGDISFVTGGTNGVFFKASGSVGIGTTGPNYKLEVQSSSGNAMLVQSLSATPVDTFVVQGLDATNANVKLKRTSGADLAKLYDTGATNDGALGLYDGSAVQKVLIRGQGDSYINGGNVGIGTTGPGAKLHLYGDADYPLKIESTDWSAGLDLVDSGGAAARIWTVSPYSSLNFSADGGTTTNMTIRSGNVGIGTTSPTRKLDIVGDGYFSTNLSVGVGITAPLITLTTGASSGYVLQSDGSGNASWVSPVGIGGTYVGGSGTTNYLPKFTGSTTLGNSQLFDNSTFVGIGGTAAGTNPYLYIKASDGNVGIGTTNPGRQLEISGANPLLKFNSTAGGEEDYTIGSDGWGFIVYSDTDSKYRMAIGKDGGVSIGDSYYQTDPGADNVIIEGNVGIGTTSPSQKLHVEGQCVTGDTLLPMVTESQGSNVKSQNDNSKVKTEEIKYARIDQIKGGEQVLSLDESTGQIVPARIKGLLDMGVQPVYRLTTEDGRSIRTTGNHPYLTQEGWTKVVYLQEGEEIAVVNETLVPVSSTAEFNSLDKDHFPPNEKGSPILSNTESVGGRRQINQRLSENQRISLLGIENQLINNKPLNVLRQFLQVSSASMSEFNLKHDNQGSNSDWIFSKGTQPFFSASRMASFKELTYSESSGNLDSISSISQPAGLTDLEWYSLWETLSAKESSITERMSSKEGVSKINNCGTPSLSKTIPDRDPGESLKTDKGTTPFQGTNLASLRPDNEDFGLAIQRNYTREVEFVKIGSIEYVGEEQVYDIEVEGTHNFVANGIIAHNTYISTNLSVGVGVTTPAFTMVTGAGSGKIFVSDGSGNASWSDITSVGVGGSGTTNYLPKWLSSSTLGNASFFDNSTFVGIGGTAVSTAPQLYVGSNGNVGIGTTGPGAKLDIVGGSVGIHGYNRLRFYSGDDTTYASISNPYSGSRGLNFYFGGSDTNNIGMKLDYLGNVGIGTTSPTRKLDVVGDGYFSTNLSVGVGITSPKITLTTGASSGYVLTSDASGNASWSNITSVGVGGSGTTNYLPKWIAGTTLGNASFFDNGTFVGIGGTASGTNPHLYVKASDGNVGIGTTSPVARLEIASGNILLSNDQEIRWKDTGAVERRLLKLGNDDNVYFYMPNSKDIFIRDGAGGANRVTFKASGNVGIGTTDPTRKLDVVGNGYFSTNLAVGVGITAPLITLTTGASSGYVLTSDGSGNASWSNITSVGVGGSGTTNYLPKWLSGSTLGNASFFDNGTFVGIGGTAAGTNPHLYVKASDGNVGIGTTNPGALLELSKTGTQQRIRYDSTRYVDLYANSVGHLLITPSENKVSIYDGSDAQSLQIFNGASGGILLDAGSGDSYIQNGSVGIGSTSPASLLDVHGTAWLRGAASGTSGLYVKSDGNVGVGTTSPGKKLEIYDDSLSEVRIRTSASGDSKLQFAEWDGVNYEFVHDGGDDKLYLNTNVVANMMTWERLTGNVGIGTTNPGSYKLNVAGNGYFSTNLSVGVGITSPKITLTTGASSGYVLTSDASGNASWSNITSVGVGGSGTTNYLPKFTGANTLGNSVLYETGGNVGIGTTAPGSYKLNVNGNISTTGYLSSRGYLNPTTDNLIYNGDFETNSLDGWTGFDSVGSGATAYSGNYYATAQGSSTVLSDDYIPVDPDYDVFQLEGYFYKLVDGTTPGVIYFGYIAYDSNKTAITTAPCGTYCYFAASGYDLPADAAWHKLSATTTGEGTSYPNFPVGTKYVRVLVLINYGSSSDAVTLMDHVTLKRINHGPLFVGNNFTSSNWVDQQQVSKIYTTNSNNLTLMAPSSGIVSFYDGATENVRIDATGNVGIGTTGPGSILELYSATTNPTLTINAGSTYGSVISLNSGSNEWNLNSFGSGSVNAGKFAIRDGTDYRLTIDQGGNVGIGTTNPGSYKLNVVGNGYFSTSLGVGTSMVVGGNLSVGGSATISSIPSVADNNVVLTSDGGVIKSISTSAWDKSSADDYSAWILKGDSGTAQSIGNGNTANIYGGSGITTVASDTDTLTIAVDNGNGIVFESGQVAVDESYAFAWTGAQSWSNTADFNGNVSIADTDIALDGASTNFTATGNLSFNTDDLFINKTSGFVGIGTATPANSPSALTTMNTVLQIGNNVNAPELRLAGPNTAGVSSKIVFDNSSGGQGMSIFFTSDTTPYGPDGLVFWNENGGTANLKINRDDGYVGIGNTNPTRKLDVTGDGYFSTNLSVGVGITSPKITLTTGASSGYLLQSDGSGNASWVSPVGIGGTYVGGSGTTNYLPKFTGANTLGNSQLFDNSTFVGIGGTAAGTNPHVYVKASDGNVGIGTTNPEVSLHVQNSSAAPLVMFRDTSSQGFSFHINSNDSILESDANHLSLQTTRSQDDIRFIGNSNEIMRIDSSSGYVGIGTSSPARKLDVVGDGYFSTNLSVGVGITSPLITLTTGAASGYVLQSDGSGNASWVSPVGIGGTYVGGSGTTNYLPKFTGSTTLGNSQLFDNSTFVGIGGTAAGTLPHVYVSASDGNVGIGTTGPGAKLSVNNSASGFGANIAGSNGSSFSGATSTVILNDENGSAVAGYFENGGYYAFLGGPGFGGYFQDSSSNVVYLANGTYAATFMGGNVGIGTTSPTRKLDVTGNGYFSTNLSVGVGITAPLITLTTGAASGYVLTSDASGNASWASASSTGIGGSGTTNYLSKFTGANTLGNSQLFDNSTFVGIGGTAAGTLPHLYVKAADGNVGIGTTSPTYKLDVNGNVRLGGSTTISSIPSVADNNIVLTSDGGVIKSISTTAWDKNASDDLTTSSNLWVLKGDSGSSQTMNIGNTASFVGGIGIGTTASATDTLTINVNQAYGFAWSGAQSWSNTATFNGNLLFGGSTGILSSGGNIGIGNTSPGSYKLNVTGNGYFSTNLSVGVGITSPIITLTTGASSGYVLQSDGSGNASWVSPVGIGGTYVGGSGTTNYLPKFTAGTTLGNSQLFDNSTFVGIGGTAVNTNPHLYVKASDGNVGIGTTSPGAKLEVSASGNAAQMVVSESGGNGTIRLSANGASPYNPYVGTTSNHPFFFVTNNNYRWGASAAGGFAFGSTYYSTDPGQNNMIIEGNIGIGTTNPLQKLHVNGDLLVGGNDLMDSSNTTRLSLGSTSIFSGNLSLSGNLAIGGSVTLQNSEQITNSSDGTLRLGGGGGTYNGYLDFDFEEEWYAVNITAGKGSGSNTAISFDNNILFRDGRNFVFGNSADTAFRWNTAGAQDFFQISTALGSAAQSGYISIMESADEDSANRVPSSYTNNPTLRIYSADATQADDYLELYHDQTNAIFDWGNGNLGLLGGNVGIGTTNPLEMLHVEGDTYITKNLHVGGEVYFGSIDNDTYIGYHGTDNLKMVAGGYDALFVGSSGFVGIGTTSPTEALDVAGNIKLSGVVKGSDISFAVRKTTDQTVTTYATDKVTWDTEDFDTNNNFASSRFTTTVAGKYIITANVQANLTNAGDRIYPFIYKNGSAIYVGNYYRAYTTSQNQISNVSAVVTSDGDDYFEIYMNCGSASSCTINGAGSSMNNTFTGARLFGADVAEYYSTNDNTLNEGDIVAADRENKALVTKGNSNFVKQLGIITTNPSVVLGNKLGAYNVQVGLAGKLPVKVTDANGPIANGDMIVASHLPGIGAKAVQSGYTVAQSLEPFNPDELVCEQVNSIEEIVWPEDFGYNDKRPCFTLPDGTHAGKVLAIIDNNYHDPDVYLSSTGDLTVSELPPNIDLSQIPEVEALRLKAESYQIKLPAGQIVEKIGNFARVAVAQLNAGLIETQDLIAKKIIAEQEIKTPLLESDEIKTERISLSEIEAQNGEIVFNLDEEDKIKIKNKNQETVVEINSEGDVRLQGGLTARQATFSGTVHLNEAEATTMTALEISAQNAKLKDATVSGTLHADKIESKQLDEMADNFANVLKKIEELENKQATASASPIPEPSLTPTPTLEPTPTPESSTPGVEEKTEEAEEQDVADMEIDELLKEILGEDYQVDEVNTGNQIEINEEILVEPVLANPEDQTTMQIADSLSLNNNMTLTANAVNTLEGPLYLQNLGLGGIDILAGKIVIDQNGNASFGQNITVEGKLAANTIEPNGNELVIDLGTLEAESSTPGVEEKQLLVKGNQGETVASINASGSAQFKQLATEKLDIQSDLTATQSGAIIAAQDNYIQNGIFAPAVETNATSGVAYLPSNESQIMIYNQNITENSLIYITPSSNTQNKVLYVKNKKAPIGATVDEQSGSTIKKAEKGWFTVGIDQAINGQIQFNWWIIN